MTPPKLVIKELPQGGFLRFSSSQLILFKKTPLEPWQNVDEPPLQGIWEAIRRNSKIVRLALLSIFCYIH
jgi:hypothetical protein